MFTCRKSLILFLATLMLTGTIYGFDGVDYGLPLESYDGVQAYSRGSLVGSATLPIDYQCVNLGQRFSSAPTGLQRTIGSVGDAANMWNVLPAQFGFAKYEAGNTTVKPKEGDLIIWWNNTTNPAPGHVAIHSGENATQVRVFEQNWPDGTDAQGNKFDSTAFRWLNLSQDANGKWQMASGDSHRYIKGWLRAVKVGDFTEGVSQTPYSAAFQQCYIQHGGAAALGYPYDNTNGTLPDGIYTHRWYSQNGLAYVVAHDLFKQSTNQYYAIVYNESLQKAFLLKGGFRWQYLSNANAPYEHGVPWSDEVTNWKDTTGAYGPINATYQSAQEFDLKVMLWNGTSVIIKPKTVHITVVSPPSSLPDLTVRAETRSPTSIQVWGNSIGQSITQIYLNGQYTGQLQDNTLVVNGLQEKTTYQVHSVALGPLGQILKQTEPVAVTTPAFPATTVNLTLTQAVTVHDWPPPVVAGDRIGLSFTVLNSGTNSLTILGAVKITQGSSVIDISDYFNTPVTLRPGESHTFWCNYTVLQTGNFTLMPVVQIISVNVNTLLGQTVP